MSDVQYQLPFGPHASALVRGTLTPIVRPHLHDARAMLRLPLPDLGITVGCNFACAHVLLNVISGLSRLLGVDQHKSDAAFIHLVTDRYPWNHEPPGTTLQGAVGADVLYGKFRTGFAHDLGLLVEPTPQRRPDQMRHRLRLGGLRIGIIKRPTLAAAELAELDDVSQRPSWLGSTLSSPGPDERSVDVVALYCAVRLHIERGRDRPPPADARGRHATSPSGRHRFRRARRRRRLPTGRTSRNGGRTDQMARHEPECGDGGSSQQRNDQSTGRAEQRPDRNVGSTLTMWQDADVDRHEGAGRDRLRANAQVGLLCPLAHPDVGRDECGRQGHRHRAGARGAARCRDRPRAMTDVDLELPSTTVLQTFGATERATGQLLQ